MDILKLRLYRTDKLVACTLPATKKVEEGLARLRTSFDKGIPGETVSIGSIQLSLERVVGYNVTKYGFIPNIDKDNFRVPDDLIDRFFDDRSVNCSIVETTGSYNPGNDIGKNYLLKRYLKGINT